MGNINGLQWVQYYAEKKKQQLEKQKRSRDFVQTQIGWELPESLLPVRCVKSKQVKYSYCNIQPRWFVNGLDTPQSFVYVLKAIESDEIRYVGLSDDPPRRFLEHQQNDKLGIQFKMVVVAIGNAETEREWIERCIKDGCNLLNISLTNRK